MRLTERAAIGIAGLVGASLGLLALGPGAGPGYLLSYDMVFVPKPPFTAAMFGRGGTLPRAVPSDAVVAALAHLVAADLVQKLVLLAIFVLACAGAAALLTGEHLAARLTAGVCYAWNPFVAERLILGQWALLLGYAGLPWVLAVLGKERARTWRLAGPLAVALLPAAVGGFAAMAVSALVAVPAAALAGGHRAIRVLVTCVVLAALSLPWLVPALASPVHTSGSGVAAFAARADTPFGAFGSLLLLGGAWNSQTVPYGYGGPATAAWLAVVLLALACFAVVGGSRRWPGLAVGAVAGLAIASIGITGAGAGLLRWLIAGWPGFAVLRDGQQFVAPLALAEAAGLGLGVAWLMRQDLRTRSRWLGEGRWLAVTLALIAPLVLLPGLAWGAAGRLRAVEYPADWMVARSTIEHDRAAGKVLLLPWAAYRRFGWNHGEAMLDPWPRLVSRDVIWNDAVAVGRITIPAESPQARALAARITGTGPLTAALLAAGVRYVVVDSGFGPYRSRLPGCQIVLAGPGLVVYRLPADPPRE